MSYREIKHFRTGDVCLNFVNSLERYMLIWPNTVVAYGIAILKPFTHEAPYG